MGNPFNDPAPIWKGSKRKRLFDCVFMLAVHGYLTPSQEHQAKKKIMREIERVEKSEAERTKKAK